MAIFFLFAEIGPTICCRLPDEASFLEIGGCITPHTPPLREFRPWLCSELFVSQEQNLALKASMVQGPAFPGIFGNLSINLKK